MPWTSTAAGLLDLTTTRRRADRFRFDLYVGGQLAGELAPDAARPPTVKVDTGRGPVRTLDSFHLPSSVLADINTLRDRVNVVMTLQTGDEESLGWVTWADDTRVVRGWGTERRASLVDDGFRLDQGIDRTLGWGKGANVIVIVVALAAQVILSQRIDFDPSDATLNAPVSYGPGTNRLKIMTDLLRGIGYLPPWFSRDNRLQLRAAPDPALAIEPQVNYGPGRVLADSIVESDDLLDAPNRFIVYEGSGQGAAVVGHYDLPDTAPNSINNRSGAVIPMIESQQGIANAAAAARAAKALAQTSGPTYRYASWHSPADYRHDAWDVVGFLGGRWLETSWSIVCRSGGVMTHEARQVW